MAIPILKTKLYIPPMRPELVPRPRLIERLNARVHRKLTLVSAPPGFGKTTLLAEWAGLCGRPVAWVSLDEGDNDPARFLAYLIAALQRVEESIGEGVLDMAASPHPPSMEDLVAMLINQAVTVSFAPILILDDYHLIGARPIHEALSFLLDHLPPQMHVVIATRADPPLPIARLRGRAQLAELRQADLRFTPDKAAEFMNKVTGLDLSSEQVAALTSRTEGWIAGLQMAAMSMRRKDVAGFIAAFAGSHEYIVDYFTGEVLDQQTEIVKTFLLQTSVLDRLTGSLCDAVTGQCGGQQMLERLKEANLFLVSLDDERRWYRYHGLFADLLRKRLQQAQPEVMSDLHRRASEWYEQNDLLAEAIEHALSANEFEGAARLIEQIPGPVLMHNQVATFLRWVGALPDEVVRARPRLCVLHAGALLARGRRPDLIESRLQEAAESAAFATVAGEVTALRSVLALFREDMPCSIELAHRALELLPEDNLFLRGLVAESLGSAYRASGDVVSAIRAFDEAVRIGQKSDSPVGAAMTLCHLAELYVRQAKLGEARSRYEQALALAVGRQGRPLPVASMALIGMGELLYEWDQVDAAARYVAEGIELAGSVWETGALDGYIALARVRQAQSDPDGARKAIGRARQVAIQFEITESDDWIVAAHQARLWIRQGNVAGALAWARGRGLYGKDGLDGRQDEGVSPWYDLYELERITLARLWIAHDRPDRALEGLAPLLQEARRLRRTGSAIEILVLEALAHRARGDAGEALVALKEALAFAEPEGYVRIFVDEGARMSELLRQAATRGIAAGYVDSLLAAFKEKKEKKAPALQPPASTAKLVEPLSERELEVLRLWATHLTRVEIAKMLCVSVNTIRFHLKNIYGKLDVHQRDEAICRAKELQLL